MGEGGQGLGCSEGAARVAKPQRVPDQASGLKLHQNPPDAQDAQLGSLSQRQCRERQHQVAYVGSHQEVQVPACSTHTPPPFLSYFHIICHFLPHSVFFKNQPPCCGPSCSTCTIPGASGPHNAAHLLTSRLADPRTQKHTLFLQGHRLCRPQTQALAKLDLNPKKKME